MQGAYWSVVRMAVAVLLSSASIAYAQPRPSPDAGAPVAPQMQGGPTADSLDQAARILFESARTAFNAGDYQTALARFKQAYEASARPGLLFNIATTLDRLRQDDEALATFERFLAADPAVTNRAEIDARIRSLRSAIETRDRAAQVERERTEQLERERVAREEAERARRERENGDDPPPAGGPVDSGGGTPPVLFFVAGGLTVVAGGLTIWSGLATGGLNDDYETYAASPGATQEQAKLLFDDASSQQLLTNLFIAGTAVFGVATAVLFFLTDWGGSDDDDAPANTPATTPTVSVDAHGGVAGFIHRF